MEVKTLYEFFEKNFETLILPYIKENIPRNPLSEPFWYLLEKFNWRKFRSGLVINISKGYLVPIEMALPIAATSEIIFGISLIHDDIIDRDDKRGDFPAAHIKFGIPHTIASCEYVIAFVNEMLEQLNEKLTNEEAIRNRKNFIYYQKELYASFILELINSGRLDFSLDDIFDIYFKKNYCPGIKIP